jgi:hypothetical protein
MVESAIKESIDWDIYKDRTKLVEERKKEMEVKLEAMLGKDELTRLRGLQ